MKVAEYLDWIRYSALGLGGATAGERNHQLTQELSSAGVTLVLVAQLLEQCPGTIDLARWRRGIHGLEGTQQKLTMEALEAIGAVRAGAVLRAAWDAPGRPSLLQQLRQGTVDIEAVRGKMLTLAESLVELPTGVANVISQPQQTEGIETRDEIGRLLEAFAEREHDALAADLKKHGDPRHAPGFDPQGRLAELQNLQERARRLRRQRGDLPELQEKLTQLKQRIDAASTALWTLEKQAQNLLEEYERYAKCDREELIPGLRLWLRHVEQLRNQRPDLFYPKPTDDDSLNARLAAIGEYRLVYHGGAKHAGWSRPDGLECEWTRFSLSFDVGSYKKGPTSKQVVSAYETLMGAWERFRPRFSKLERELKQYVLELFRESALSQLDDEARAEYRNADGEITDEAILQHVNSGSLSLSYQVPGTVEISVALDIDWDPEHGLAAELDGTGEIVRWL